MSNSRVLESPGQRTPYDELTSSIYRQLGESLVLLCGILEGSWKESDLLCTMVSALLCEANELKGREQERAKKHSREAPLLTPCPSRLLKGYLGRRIIHTTQNVTITSPHTTSLCVSAAFLTFIAIQILLECVFWTQALPSVTEWLPCYLLDRCKDRCK